MFVLRICVEMGLSARKQTLEVETREGNNWERTRMKRAESTKRDVEVEKAYPEPISVRPLWSGQ